MLLSSTPGACAASCRWASSRTTPRTRIACSSGRRSAAWSRMRRSRSEFRRADHFADPPTTSTPVARLHHVFLQLLENLILAQVWAERLIGAVEIARGDDEAAIQIADAPRRPVHIGAGFSVFELRLGTDAQQALLGRDVDFERRIIVGVLDAGVVFAFDHPYFARHRQKRPHHI